MQKIGIGMVEVLMGEMLEGGAEEETMVGVAAVAEAVEAEVEWEAWIGMVEMEMLMGEMLEGGVVEEAMVGVAAGAAAAMAEVEMEAAAGELRSLCNRHSHGRARDQQIGRWLSRGARSTR